MTLDGVSPRSSPRASPAASPRASPTPRTHRHDITAPDSASPTSKTSFKLDAFDAVSPRSHKHNASPSGFVLPPVGSSSSSTAPRSPINRTESGKGFRRTEAPASNRDILKFSRLKDCGPLKHIELRSLMAHAERLLQEFPLVHSVDQPVRAKIPELLGYIRTPAGTVLFEEDDEPDVCYITLSGEVEVVKDVEFVGGTFNFGDGSPTARKHCCALAKMLVRPIKQNTRNSPVPNSSHEADLALPPEKVDGVISQFGKRIATLGAGTIFGEQGLIEDTPRGATVVTKVVSEFLMIEKEDFDNVLKSEIKEAQVKQLANITKQLLLDVPFFMKMSQNVQDTIPNIVHHLRCEAGTVLFREGDAPDLCYFMLAGEVSVWKKLPGEAVDFQDKTRRQSSMVRKSVGSMNAQGLCQTIVAGLSEPSPVQVTHTQADTWTPPEPTSRKSSWNLPRHSRSSLFDDQPAELTRMPRRASRRSTVGGTMSGIREEVLLADAFRSSCSEVQEDVENDSDEEVECFPSLSDHDVYGTLVSLLGPGSLFGELALLDDQPRNATVVCRARADFLIIEKADFERTLKEEMRRELRRDLPKYVEPLLADFDFFQTLDERVVQGVPSIMTLHSETAGSVLFWEGDPPGRCYIILSGMVAVWKTQTDTHRDSGLFSSCVDGSSKELRRKCANLISTFFPEANLLDGAAASGGSFASPEVSLEERGQRGSASERASASGPKRSFSAPYDEAMGSKVAYLGTGMLFGESALIEEKPRNATVTCEQDCYFLAIEKGDFENVLAAEMRKARVRQLGAQVLRVLREFEVFQQLEPQVQEMLPEIVRYSSSPAGSVLFEQGDQPTVCYVILSGEVMVWRQSYDDHHEAHEVHAKSSGSKKIQGHGHHAHHGHAHHGHGHHGARAYSPLPHPHGDTAVHAVRSGKKASLREKPQAGHHPLGHERRSHKMPPLVVVSNAVRLRCLALAAMLAESATKEASTPCLKRAYTMALESRGEECEGLEKHGVPVAALGPGIIFGERALLSDHPRDATVTCREDCEFLVMDKFDFDRSIKQAIKKANYEKLDFLRKHAPLMKSVTDGTAEGILRFFEKVSYPRNHKFLKLGQHTDGAIYFVWKGSVECHARAPPEAVESTPRTHRNTPRIRGRSSKREELQKCGVLLRGSVFGTIVARVPSVFSIAAVSSPCEVLRVSAESLRQLPDFIVQGLRDLIDQAMPRRMEPRAECNPLQDLMAGNTTARPAICSLRQSRGFMQLPPGADLPKALHLGKVVGPVAWSNTPRGKLPAVGDCFSKAKEQSRRRALRSNIENDATSDSRSQSRASSRSPSRRSSKASRRQSLASTTLSRSQSKCQSRTDLNADLVPEPFVHLNNTQSGLISKAGQHPRYEILFDMRGVSPSSTRASTPKRPATSLSLHHA